MDCLKPQYIAILPLIYILYRTIKSEIHKILQKYVKEVPAVTQFEFSDSLTCWLRLPDNRLVIGSAPDMWPEESSETLPAYFTAFILISPLKLPFTFSASLTSVGLCRDFGSVTASS